VVYLVKSLRQAYGQTAQIVLCIVENFSPILDQPPQLTSTDIAFIDLDGISATCSGMRHHHADHHALRIGSRRLALQRKYRVTTQNKVPIAYRQAELAVLFEHGHAHEFVQFFKQLIALIKQVVGFVLHCTGTCLDDLIVGVVDALHITVDLLDHSADLCSHICALRSEERRLGKECIHV